MAGNKSVPVSAATMRSISRTLTAGHNRRKALTTLPVLPAAPALPALLPFPPLLPALPALQDATIS